MTYKTHKTTLISISIIAAGTMLLSACQKTPESEFVATKNQDELEDKIEQSRQTDENVVQVNLPQQYSTQYSDGKTSVMVNADVIFGESFPVALERPIAITQDMADTVLDVFAGDSDFYDEENVQTKQELENEILALQENLNDPDADWAQATKDSPTEYERAKKEKEAYIDTLKQLWAEAPLEKPKSYASRTFQEQVINQPGIEGGAFATNDRIIQGYFDAGKSIPAFLKISKTEVGNRIYYRNFDMGVTGIFTPSATTFAGNVTQVSEESIKSIGISDTQAVDMVKSKLESLGVGAYEPAEIGISRYIVIGAGGYDKFDLCYILFFTRSVNGLPELYSYRTPEYHEAYSAPIPCEMVVATVDASGITSFEWTSPMEVEIVSENTQLLELEQIMAAFENYIFLSGAWGSEKKSNDENVNPIIKREINIDKIELGLSRIQKQDSMGEYYLVPAWHFYGSTTTYYIDDAPFNGRIIEWRGIGHVYLTINAIDGTVIDREQGH